MADGSHIGETKILEMIANRTPLAEVLGTLAMFIEACAEGVHCALSFIDAEMRIRPVSAPSLPPEYTGKLDGVPIFPYVGPCGMAAFLREQVISENIEEDERWSEAFRSVAKRHGLEAVWSSPIFDSRRSVVGVLALFRKQPGLPSAEHLRLIEIATHLAGIAIEQELREERLHLYAEIIERSTEAVRIADANGVIVQQNSAHRKMFGMSDEMLKGKTPAVIFGHEQFAKVLRSVQESGNFNGELLAMIRGKSRIIDTQIFAVKNNEGKVVCRVSLNRDVTERRAAEDRLLSSHAELESQVAQRTSSLRELTKSLLKAQDEERRRVARDLHDSTGQTLTALKIEVANLKRQFGKGEAAFDALNHIAVIADQALQEIRTTSYLLHPPLLDEAGLACAAGWYVDGFSKRTGIRVNLEVQASFERLPSHIEMMLFRVLQESLVNVHRHAGASRVDIRLGSSSEWAIMEMRDDGRGIAPEVLHRWRTAHAEGGVGLSGIRERINDLNGQAEIESSSTGTALRVRVPLTGADKATNVAAA